MPPVTLKVLLLPSTVNVPLLVSLNTFILSSMSKEAPLNPVIVVNVLPEIEMFWPVIY